MLEHGRNEATETASEAHERPQGKPPSNGFRPGVSGNPAGAESRASREARIAALITRWAAPYGGTASLHPAEMDLLHQAAELALRRVPQKSEDAVRQANVISKIMAQVGFVSGSHRKRRPEAQPASPFDQLLGKRDRA